MLKMKRVRWREGRWLWLTLAAFVFARITGGRLPYLLLYTLLLAGALAWIWTHRGLRQVSVTYDVRPDRLNAGEPFQLRLRLYNEGLWPLPWLQVHDPSSFSPGDETTRLISLGPLRVAILERELVAHRRGVYALGGVGLRSGDPLGLCEIEATAPQRRSLIVQPRLIPIADMGLPWLQPFGARQARHALLEDLSAPAPHRPYAPGDSLRRVHWKATARYGELFTREFEPAVTAETQVFLDMYRHSYDGWPDGDERAAELALSVMEYSLRHGLTASLTTNAQARFHLPGRRGQEQLPQVLELLALARPEGRLSPAAALRLEQHLQVKSGVLVVITPNTSAELASTLLLLKRRTRPIMLLSLQPEPIAQPWHRSLHAHGITVHVVTSSHDLGARTAAAALPLGDLPSLQEVLP